MKLTFSKKTPEVMEVEIPFYYKRADTQEWGVVFSRDKELKFFTVYFNDTYDPPSWVVCERSVIKSFDEFDEKVEPSSREEFEAILHKQIDAFVNTIETLF